MAIETRFQATYRKKIEDAIEVRTNILLEGGARDFADYKDNTGYLQGLRDALKLLDETVSDISGEL